MSAQIKVVPKDQRLRITAKYNHETLEFEGDAFQFIERLMKEQRTGIGTLRLRTGRVYSMEFDFRERVDELAIDKDSSSM